MLVLASLALLAACRSTPVPSYDGPPRPALEIARLRGVDPGVGWNPWCVGIEDVDGRRTTTPPGEPPLLLRVFAVHEDPDLVEYEVEVEPGEHDVGLRVDRGSIDHSSTRRRFSFRAEAGHEYRIEAEPSEKQPPITFVVRDLATEAIVFDSRLSAEGAVAARIDLDAAAWSVLDWRVAEKGSSDLVRATSWRPKGEGRSPWTQSIDVVSLRTRSASPALEAVMLDAARDLRARYEQLEWSVVERDEATRICRWSGVPRGEHRIVHGVTCIRSREHLAYLLRYATRAEITERELARWSDRLRSAVLQ